MKNLLNRFDYNAPVTLSFVLVSGLVLLMDMLTQGQTTREFFCVYAFSPTDPLGYARLFSHVLGHSGPDHYIGNMMLFLLVAPSVEERYGSGRLLAMMAVTAVATGLLHVFLQPGTALLGASGEVFMLIVLSSVAGAKEGKIPVTLLLVAALYLGQQVVDGLFLTDNVSQLTHIAGGVIGVVFGMSVRKRRW